METVQNTAFPLSTSAFPTSPIDCLQVELGVLPLSLHRKMSLLKYSVRLNCTPNLPFINHICPSPSSPHSNLHLCYRIRNVLQSINCPNFLTMPFIIPSPLPPWTPSQITIDTTLPSKKLTNDYEHTHFLFQELLIKYHSSSKYFTDGSKFSSFTGCSIIHLDSCIIRFSLPSSFSILSAELYAIYLAINSAVQSSNNTIQFLKSRN